MTKFRIEKKILVVNILITAVLIIFAISVYFHQKKVIIKKTYSELTNVNQTLINMITTSYRSSIKSYLKASSDSYVILINELYEKFDKKETIKIASELISEKKIGKSGYVYLLDAKTGEVLFHPYIDLPEELYLEMLKNINKDELDKIKRVKKGYFEYDWKNPEENSFRKKSAYLDYIKDLEIIIGVSAYKDEFSNIIDKNDFKNEILSIKIDEDGYSYIVSDKGKVIIHPDYPEGTNWYFKADPTGKRYVKEMCDKKEGIIQYFYSNGDIQKEKLAVFNSIPELHWIVVSGSYLDNFMQPVTILRMIIVFSILLLLSLSIIQHGLLKMFIVNPIAKFSSSIKDIIKNKNLKKIEINSSDEIGELSEEFNILINQIINYEDNLKNLVETRTEDLLKANEELRKLNYISIKNEEFLKILFEAIPYPIFFKNDEFKYIKFNSAFINILNMDKNDIYGKTAFEIFPKEIAEIYNKKDVELFESARSQSYETKMIIPDRTTKTVIFNKAVCIVDGKKVGIVGVLQDITEIKEFEEKLKEDSIKDYITSLYNRRGIEHFGNKLIRNSIRNNNGFAVLMIDIDYFKQYNDLYGHQKGDECLSNVAKEIKKSCYRTLDLVGRYGGEEFIVILTEVTKEGALDVARRINSNIKKLNIEHEGNKNQKIITVSIGMHFEIPNINTSLENYIYDADSNLYKAKEKGRDSIVSN